MNALRKYLDKIKPNFEEGGKLHAFRSVFDGFETFLFVPNTTSKSGVNVHDAIDSKRIMIFVVMALLPALLFGMYNIGYQNYAAAGVDGTFWEMFGFGLLAVLPKIIVSYVVGLGIEFIVAQWKHEEIQEGYLVTGILVPMIVPVDCPLWIIAIACAFAVIFAKEIFGGTGMNIWNPALLARAFFFFSYPSMISGDAVWIAGDPTTTDAISQATPLAQMALGQPLTYTSADMFWGLIPGSIGETSTFCVLLGALLLLLTNVASWRIMLSVFVGGFLMSLAFEPVSHVEAYQQLLMGGFAFGAVFMATDPVTSAQTNIGKYIYGLLIGAMAVIIRCINPGYPEGMMLAILLMNTFAPLIDWFVVQSNIKHRLKRAKVNA